MYIHSVNDFSHINSHEYAVKKIKNSINNIHLALPRRDWLEQSSWLNYYYDLKNREKKRLECERKIKWTKLLVQNVQWKLMLMLSGLLLYVRTHFFCSCRIRYAYAVATIKWKIFRRTTIRFSVNAVVLINAIDLICMWIIPRFFYFVQPLPEYKEHIQDNMYSRLHLKYNTIAYIILDEHMIS